MAWSLEMDLSDFLHSLLTDDQDSDDFAKGQRIVQSLDTDANTLLMYVA